MKVVRFRTSGSLDESHSEHFVELPDLSGQFMNAPLVTFTHLYCLHVMAEGLKAYLCRGYNLSLYSTCGNFFLIQIH